MAWKVIIVDDVRSERLLCRRHFERSDLDFEVREAKSGEEAIEVLDAERVDVILSDHRMGEMSGIEVLKHALEKQPEALRFLMTGYADPELAERAATEAQVHAFIEKPLRAVRMGEALEREIVERYLRPMVPR